MRLDHCDSGWMRTLVAYEMLREQESERALALSGLDGPAGFAGLAGGGLQ